MLYILDTNILIYPNRVSHPMDVYPSFWEKMSGVLNRKDVISIDKVKDEIYDHKDSLSDWCKDNCKSSFWASTTISILEYAKVQNWAQNKNYNQRALLDFADSKNADPFLVAYALHTKQEEKEDITIVTLEVSAPESIKSVKLPDVCIDFDIRHININDFFREIKVNF